MKITYNPDTDVMNIEFQKAAIRNIYCNKL